MANNKFLIGVYNDEDTILHAVSDVRGGGVNIHEVYTPYAIHGMDQALGYKRASMGVAAFLFGITGTALAFLLTFWTLGFDWPMNIGGKNFIPFPTNIPIVFELTVLLASYGMAFTFFVMEGLGPTTKPVIFDQRITDDKFVMAIDLSKNKDSEKNITEILSKSGAVEVNVKEV